MRQNKYFIYNENQVDNSIFLVTFNLVRLNFKTIITNRLI